MKRAVVLSGGGSLGAMQVGALRAMIERSIVPHIVVGCSVGALNASFLATAPDLPMMERAARVWDRVTTARVYPGTRLRVIWRFLSGQDSLYDNRSFYAFLQESGCTPATTFGDVAGAELYVTATHLRSGRLHVFGDNKNDRVLDALMASTALTPLHPPWEIDGERYVDGGTVTPLPLRVALDRGATEIYAIHLRKPGQEQPAGRVRGVTAHINQAVSTMLRLQAEHDLLLAETARRVRFHYLTLWPEPAIEPTDFGQSQRLLAQGYEQMAALLAGDGSPAPAAPRTRRRWWPSLRRITPPADSAVPAEPPLDPAHGA